MWCVVGCVGTEMVETLAGGSGTSGKRDGIGSRAQFDYPSGVAVDREGTIFVADWGSLLIRSINRTSQITSTFAGSGNSEGSRQSIDGIGSAASILSPASAAYCAAEHSLYVGCDRGIRRVNLNTKQVTTVRTAVNNGYFNGIDVLSNGIIIVSCFHTNSVYAVQPSSGHTLRLAGTGESGATVGEGSRSDFNNVRGIAVDEWNDCIYVCDRNNHRICRIVISGKLLASGLTSQESTASVNAAIDSTHADSLWNLSDL